MPTGIHRIRISDLLNPASNDSVSTAALPSPKLNPRNRDVLVRTEQHQGSSNDTEEFADPIKALE